MPRNCSATREQPRKAVQIPGSTTGMENCFTSGMSHTRNHPSRPTSQNRRSRPHHHGKSQSQFTPNLGLFCRVTDNAELTARCFERLGVAPFCIFQLGIIRKSAEWPKSEVGNQMRFLI